MQNADTYLGILRERGRRGLPLKRVYRHLFNREVYLKAYGRIYRNHGAMTRGVTDDTADGMSLEKIDALIEALRYERYQCKPARRVSIPKKNGKKRPLGITSWTDKLLAEAIRLILDAYFDIQFSEHSHGFREGRGCGTALREIHHHWQGSAWFIEGDIADCFGSLNHELLVSLLSEKIHDGRFIRLIQKFLNAGYLEGWKFNQTLSGVPQGSVVSPVLSNILLNQLDRFVETDLVPGYTRGKKRQRNSAYNRLIDRATYLSRRGRTKQAQQLRQQARKLPSIQPQDPGFRRLSYCRYADDFGLALIGSKAEADEIKRRLTAFLRDELKLTLSGEKTLVTHARTKAAKFLGYEITILQEDRKQCRTSTGRKVRNINGGVGLRVPRAVLLEKCKRYQRGGKPVHRTELLNESDFTILSTYQLEYRGLVEYYRLAYNLHSLNQLRWVMEQSLTKTLAHKHKTSVAKIYDRYRSESEGERERRKVLQVTVPREGKPPLVATWGGIPLTWNLQANPEDRTKLNWNSRSELENRLLAQVCEICGTTRMTEQIEVHHLRALKDLNTYEGREKPLWVKIMAARRRKTLVLCRTCHDDLHAGRLLRRNPVSRSRM